MVQSVNVMMTTDFIKRYEKKIMRLKFKNSKASFREKKRPIS